MLPLFEKFASLNPIVRHPIGSFPTPIMSAPELARRAGVAEVWIKRDDLTAKRYGGNKVRKLELLLGDALAKDYKGVWTVGAIGSNHVVATALYARDAGLDVHIHHFPQPLTDTVRLNCLVAGSLATQLRLGHRLALPFALLRRAGQARLERAPNRLYTIPAGGSTPLGELGYVNAAIEIATQVETGELPRPNAIVVPVGTGGTLAGLVTGLALTDLDVPVVGVRVVDRIVVNRAWLGRLIRKAVQLLGIHGVKVGDALRKDRFQLDHAQFGRAYGLPTAAATEAVETTDRACGLCLETTYTGKAMAGMLQSGRDWVGENGRILFVNTFNSRPVAPLMAEGFDWTKMPRRYARFAPNAAAP